MSERSTDSREVALGLAHVGARAGAAAGRAALGPARLALRAPVVGPPARRVVEDLADDGRRTEARARVQLEQLAGTILSSPEVERAADRVLAGKLTDAVARSLVEHRVAERVATQIVAITDVDQVVTSVLDHELTERAVDRALESPGLERLVVRVLDSRLVDEIVERVLQSPEMERVIEYIAMSPQLLGAISHHTDTLADEMVADVRRSTHKVDDLAERTVRGWLRRPRPSPS